MRDSMVEVVPFYRISTCISFALWSVKNMQPEVVFYSYLYFGYLLIKRDPKVLKMEIKYTSK